MRQSRSTAAARLLRMLGLRIHARQASHVIPVHIAGKDNIMADIVSRAFRGGEFFHAKSNLVEYFNSNFPLPQNQSWVEFLIPTALTSRVISCLRGKPLPLEQLLRLPVIAKNIGHTGAPMLPSSRWTPSSEAPPRSTETLHSQPLLLGSGRVATVEDLKSKFRESKTRLRPSPRPLNWLENAARSTEVKANTTSLSNA